MIGGWNVHFRIKIIALLCFTFFIIFIGHFYWKQQIREMAAHVSSHSSFVEDHNFIKPRRIIIENQASEQREMFSQLVLAFEEQFVDVILNFKDAINELTKKAESDYYRLNINEPQNFRDFIAYNINEIDKIQVDTEKEYRELYDEFTNILLSNGFNQHDAIIYYILFEEITAQTQIGFISHLISLQE